MKKTKKMVSLFAALLLALSLTANVSASSTVFKMQEDFESYSETSDFILYWSAQRACDAVSLELDTNSVLEGKNSLRTDYNLDVKPGWATIIHYPDQEHYSDALPSNCDGIKFTVKASCPMRIRFSPAFEYISGHMFIYASPEPREYTIRFEDLVGVEDEAFDFSSAAYFSGISTVVFGEDQPKAFQRTGSVWYDNIYFFEGDDPTDLSTEAEAMKNAPTTTKEITTTTSAASTSAATPGSTSAGADASDPTVSTAAPSTQPTEPASNANAGLYALGGIIGAIVVLAVAGGVVGFILYRKKKGAAPDADGESPTDDGSSDNGR